ncbi:TetR/AcrR family transcriptional regulator [Brevibacterium litoralis]|uniref:TetR/AcrR family transcriptional regulator n=1 Tax=Brevibacterium litoralis TaxID=3138935 RepID=UPI0032EBDD4F
MGTVENLPPGGRRAQIIEVAAGLFADRGFDGVSMNDVGAAAGISGAAIYKHFSGKQQLLGEMLVGISETLLGEGTARVLKARGFEVGPGRAGHPEHPAGVGVVPLGTGEDDPAGASAAVRGLEVDEAADVLRVLVAWHVEFALDTPALITLQFRDLARLVDDDRHRVRRLQRAYVEMWVAVIERAVGADTKHARSAAHAVFGLINSTPHSARLDRNEMAALLERMALAALHAALG